MADEDKDWRAMVREAEVADWQQRKRVRKLTPSYLTFISVFKVCALIVALLTLYYVGVFMGPIGALIWLLVIAPALSLFVYFLLNRR